MKKLLFVLIPTASLLCADPLTATALSPNQWLTARLPLADGDSARGAALYEQNGCGGCHGLRGVPDNRRIPVLAGQRAPYAYKTLLDYRNQRLSDGPGEVMVGMAQALSDQQAADLATWLAGLPRPAPSPEAAAAPDVVDGDPARLIPPCEACHGSHGEGWDLQPAIRGQNRDFLAEALNRFKSGQRANDIHDGMGQFARKLTDTEIRAIAEHYGR